ncbi:MAG TPA: iron-sulfur cluster assembly protein [Methylocella sp.]|nr:iron-sulfur cluster assembly protein [Methylocella sp.]
MDTIAQSVEKASSPAPERAGSPPRPCEPCLSAIIDALRTVHDPEIPVNVYDLGLVYRVEMKNPGEVEIDMTLTAPGCPVAGDIMGWVRIAVSNVESVSRVAVNLVFDPPWDQSKMSDEAKLELGLS